MRIRGVSSWLLSVLLIISATLFAHAASASNPYTPLVCYMRAERVAELLKLGNPTIQIGEIRQCPGLGGVYHGRNASQNVRKVRQIRDRHARKIRQLGYMRVPKSVRVTFGQACGAGLKPNTRATIRQRDFSLELKLPGVTLGGAILQKYVVFALMDINTFPGINFDAAWGELNNGEILLRSSENSCRLTIRER